MDKKGILEDIWGIVFLAVVLAAVSLLFLVGTFGKEQKVKSQVQEKIQETTSDYLLIQYLRMPVNCDGKTESVLDCWDTISLSKDLRDKCVTILADPTNEFFKGAGIPQYLVQFIYDRQIKCPMIGKTGSSDSGLKDTFVSDVVLPSSNPNAKLQVHLELIP